LSFIFILFFGEKFSFIFMVKFIKMYGKKNPFWQLSQQLFKG